MFWQSAWVHRQSVHVLSWVYIYFDSVKLVRITQWKSTPPKLSNHLTVAGTSHGRVQYSSNCVENVERRYV